MKHELIILCSLLTVYTNFQIDISKHFEKKSEKLSAALAGSPADLKLILHSNVFGHQRDRNYPTVMKKGVKKLAIKVYVSNLKDLSSLMRPWVQKNEFDLLLAVQYVKVTRLRWCHTYQKMPNHEENSYGLLFVVNRSNVMCPDCDETRTWCVAGGIYQVWNWYLKTCGKSKEKPEKSKTRKNNRPNSENKIFAKNGTYVEKFTYIISSICLDL